MMTMMMSRRRVRVVTLTLVVMTVLSTKRAEGGRTFFVFGDSLVDSGNNNYLPTTARADSLPYGIDYPTHRPTGRFSNGYNLPDLISQHIGSEATLPYLSPELSGEKLLIGANFASAGIGILNDTGIQFVGILRMFEQFALFEQYQQRLSAEVGAARAARIVNGALVLMTLGGNDFVNNYFLTPVSVRSRQFTVPQYCRYLISEYRKILMRLYELGARRVLVTGTGPLGCVPSQLATRSSNGECVPELQQAAQIFNPLLVQMTREINSQVGSDIACCGQGRFNGVGLCTAVSNLCPNRDIYTFWDPYHPSQRALGFIVRDIFSGTSEIMNPMNLSTIMAIDSNIY
ncbi:GDSL esterase/lipase [Mucuna pruriens]|uniref:GDSL esterase/lipase n=1 Tax=Mucuna pruriens TaxID=157652 RepID=A0A371GED9_MUCPR|nr:GDSL esterase/lipase [Mucuna pruriens]